jgi:hypothetical protein
VVSGVATSITSSSATVSGIVNPEGLATSYRVEYGTSTAYGTTTSATSIGSGTSPVVVTATLSKLAAGTTYHWRIVATNANGTSNGVGRVFRTAVPAISGLPVTTVPRHARRFPYVFAFSGTLRLPQGETSKVGCKGTVSVRIKRGTKTVVLKRAGVNSRCGWRVSARLGTRASVPGKGKLAVIVSFGGNAALRPHTDKAFDVFYG